MTSLGLRRIAPMILPGITPAEIDTEEPKLKRAKPTALLVDDTYQRNLSERSLRLIRKMVGRWDWASFSPPRVVETANGMHVVDGQHTAIAAATLRLESIPVLVVDAPSIQDRAKAFLGCNTDRIIVTQNQLYHAGVKAGDEESMRIHKACQIGGVAVLRNPPQFGIYKPGECIAISTVRTLVKRRGVERAGRVLKICGDAKLAPVPMAAIRACDELLYEKQFNGYRPSDFAISTLLRKGGEKLFKAAAMHGAAHEMLHYKALAVIMHARLSR